MTQRAAQQPLTWLLFVQHCSHSHKSLSAGKGCSAMKKLVVVGLLVLGGLFVLKKTNLCSYATTLWSNGRAALKKQIPRQFEIDRVRNEIERLDADVRALLTPIAEKQALIQRLERDI